MGSRLRDNPSQLFVCWCEVVGRRGDQPPWIIQKFPSNYKDEEILKSVPLFTFPCKFDNSAVQHFSFVLTSLDSKWTYGFCRHAPDSHTALLFLSYLPWHETFYKLLNHLSELMTTNRTGELWACLQSLYQADVPRPGSEVTFPYADNKFFIAQCTNHLKLPTIPDNRNLSEYYNAVDSNNMMIVFASMLFERRIIVTSKRLSRLSACVQAANSVIYPMQWQHIFIPVLPEHLIDYLLAPMPFLIGVSSNLIQKVNSEEIGDAVVLDADNNQVQTPFDDLDSLPEDVVHSLKRNLKNPNTMLGDSVARAFLRALVQLIGNYREALQFREEDRLITFNRDKFVSSRPPDFQPFVEKMLELQIFQQFIDDRLDQLNSGRQTSDEFELEVSVHCEKSSSKVKQQFKNVVTNVRKESGAIMKTVKTKTNMAGKSVAKSVSRGSKQVKERGRQNYKGLRGKLKDINTSPQGNATWLNGSPPKPRSAPSSPTLPVKMRPKTMVDNAGYSAKISYKRASQSHLRDEANHGPRKYELIEQGTGLGSPPSSDTISTPSPQSLDLLGDMQEVLSRLSGPMMEKTNSITSTGSSSSHSSSDSECSSGANSPNSTATQITLRNKPDSLSTTSDISSNKDGSEADLIYLQSPSDEIFDPLIAKSIPRGSGGGPPLPSRPSQPPPPIPTSASAVPQKKSTSTSFLHHGGGNRSSWATNNNSSSSRGGFLPLGTSASLSHMPQHSYLHHHRPNNTTRFPTTPAAPSNPLAPTNAPSRLTSSPSPTSRSSTSPSPGEMRPFSTLQSSMGTPIGCQNPMYNQHILPSVANQLSSGTRGGSAAAAFASSLITHNSEDKSGTAAAAATSGSSLRPGQYVQFEPPLLAKKEALANQSLSSSVSQPPPPLRSHKDLLGDFSSDFQKLSVNSGSSAGNPSVKSSTLPSNNNTSSINNNVLAKTKNTDSKANLNQKNWATFN